GFHAGAHAERNQSRGIVAGVCTGWNLVGRRGGEQRRVRIRRGNGSAPANTQRTYRLCAGGRGFSRWPAACFGQPRQERAVVAAGALTNDYLPRCAKCLIESSDTKSSGSTRVLLRLIVQCRCGPVARPVMPTFPRR